jgi:predicted transcriptional regulator
MHARITQLDGEAAGRAGPEEGGADANTDSFTPAASVRKSLANQDHILSLIDGKPYKTLRRHLAGHGLTPE